MIGDTDEDTITRGGIMALTALINVAVEDGLDALPVEAVEMFRERLKLRLPENRR